MCKKTIKHILLYVDSKARCFSEMRGGGPNGHEPDIGHYTARFMCLLDESRLERIILHVPTESGMEWSKKGRRALLFWASAYLVLGNFLSVLQLSISS